MKPPVMVPWGQRVVVTRDLELATDSEPFLHTIRQGSLGILVTDELHLPEADLSHSCPVLLDDDGLTGLPLLVLVPWEILEPVSDPSP